MIKPICYICKKELKEFGALLFSPPDEIGQCSKTHLCEKCYTEMWINYIRKTEGGVI